MDFESLLKERTLLLDGAMGTQLLKAGFSGCLESLSLSHPEVIEQIHTQYLEAGADIITTNTFGAANQGAQTTLAAVQIARKAADNFKGKKGYVAGAIGALSADETRYEAAITALLDGGVDIILLETIYDIEMGQAAINAIERVLAQRGCNTPYIISATASAKHHNPIDVLDGLRVGNALAVGINCSFGASEMLPHIKELKQRNYKNICAYPNCGVDKTLSADEFAGQIEAILDCDCVDIIGGCCGTTPKHIRALRELIDRRKR